MSATDPLPLIDAALRGAFIAVVLLLAVGLARSRSAHPAARAGLCLMLGLAVQTVSGLPLLEHHAASLWQAPLVGVSVGNSMLFWLFTRALFDDDFVLRRRHLALWAAVVAMGLSFYLTMAPPRIEAWFTAPLAITMRWTPVVFGVLALAATVSQWRADLVEPRRRLRLFILLSGSAYTLVMAAVRLSTPHGRLTDLNASLDVAALLAIVASFATVVLRVSTTLLPEDVELPGQAQARADAWSDGLATTANPGVDGTSDSYAQVPASATSTDSARAPSSAASPASTTSASSFTSAASAMPATSAGSGSWGPMGATASIDATSADSAGRSALAIHDASAAHGTTTPSRRGASPPDPEQDQLAQALARAMSERHVYRQEDLSVASLAAQLGVAEYRLRRLINQRLGHRNFNAYVNGLRLDQARAALADPAQRQLPVLTIALDAGFGSIGPFNRAFKAATGLTPTEYRRQHLDDVASSAGQPAGPITPAAAARSPADHT